MGAAEGGAGDGTIGLIGRGGGGKPGAPGRTGMPGGAGIVAPFIDGVGGREKLSIGRADILADGGIDGGATVLEAGESGSSIAGDALGGAGGVGADGIAPGSDCIGNPGVGVP